MNAVAVAHCLQLSPNAASLVGLGAPMTGAAASCKASQPLPGGRPTACLQTLLNRPSRPQTLRTGVLLTRKSGVVMQPLQRTLSTGPSLISCFCHAVPPSSPLCAPTRAACRWSAWGGTHRWRRDGRRGRQWRSAPAGCTATPPPPRWPPASPPPRSTCWVRLCSSLTYPSLAAVLTAVPSVRPPSLAFPFDALLCSHTQFFLSFRQVVGTLLLSFRRGS